MPEENKEPLKKPEDIFSEIAYYLIPLFLLAFITSNVFVNTAWWEAVFYDFIESLIYLVYFFLFLLFASLFTFLYYSYKLNTLLEEEYMHGYKEKTVKSTEAYKNERWQRIIDHIESEHPNDWRIAILEADAILDEILTKMGYEGDSIADKLKQIERSDFHTLEKAWEAHKIRNKVVHEADFALSKREAKRIVGLYRSVFEEFRFI
ncbi:MAG: hypothetical protein ACQEP6_03395 [Patescibacteria group bacterium]